MSIDDIIRWTIEYIVQIFLAWFDPFQFVVIGFNRCWELRWARTNIRNNTIWHGFYDEHIHSSKFYDSSTVNPFNLMEFFHMCISFVMINIHNFHIDTRDRLGVILLKIIAIVQIEWFHMDPHAVLLICSLYFYIYMRWQNSEIAICHGTEKKWHFKRNIVVYGVLVHAVYGSFIRFFFVLFCVKEKELDK